MDLATTSTHRPNDRLTLFRNLATSGALPYYREVQSETSPTVTVEGHRKIMLASNNYLGLATDRRVLDAAHRALDGFGSTATGSRLLNGTLTLHQELEHELAVWHGTESALVFTTGYQASLGALTTVLGPEDSVVVDAEAHASLRDGCTLSGANVRTFQHNSPASLAEQLDRMTGRPGQKLVVVDGVYSMAGDFCALDQISAICRARGAILMVDEAHSVGLFGSRRTGVTELFGLEDRVDVRMGTFSKALASVGGYVVGTHDLIDAMKTTARSLIFTASAVPPAVASALASVRILRTEDGASLARLALSNASYLRGQLASLGLEPASAPVHLPGRGPVTPPIVSIRIGDEASALAAWNEAFSNGAFVSLATYPAVPAGSALFRLCVMATHDIELLDRGAEIVARAVHNNSTNQLNQPNG